MPTIAEDHVALIGRLCGGLPAARGERLALLGALLGAAGGIWSPEMIRTISPLDGAATEGALGSLKRAGVLIWDQRGGGYRVPAPMRPAVTALYLLLQPTAPEELIRAQATLFHVSRDDPEAQQRTLIGLCEILADDVIQLGDLGGRPLAEQLHCAALLERHVADAEALLATIAQESSTTDLVGRALDLVGELARGVSSLLGRLAAHSADQIPRGRSNRAPAELRAAVRAADLTTLADAICAQAGRAPRLRALPDADHLARALRSTRGALVMATIPDAGDLARAALEDPEPDALARLQAAMDGRAAQLADLVRKVEGWEAAGVVHHGAVRLHEVLLGTGHPGLQPDGTLVDAPAPGVARVSVVTLPVAA